MKKLLKLLPLLLLAACSSNTTVEKLVTLNFSDEMLFEGANSMQMPLNVELGSFLGSLNIVEADVKNIGVKEASIEVAPEQVEMVESLLLQVVSDNHDLISVATLSPVDKSGLLSLSTAEEIDLLPYFKDNGCTWVLDVNLKVDDMTDLTLSGSLKLSVEHTSK